MSHRTDFQKSRESMKRYLFVHMNFDDEKKQYSIEVFPRLVMEDIIYLGYTLPAGCHLSLIADFIGCNLSLFS